MPKPRATRKPSGQWANFRALICELYTTKTLEEVISYLSEQRKFVVTKRQLVYRLGKWGCTKYNKVEEGKEIVGSPEDYIKNEIDDSIDDEEGSVTEDEATHYIQRANALLAISDGHNAWGTFLNDVAVGEEDVTSLVALARSAETPEQCQETLKLLERCASKSSDPVAKFKCYLLCFHVLDVMSYGVDGDAMQQVKDRVKEDISATVSSILDGNGPRFLLKEAGSVDMIAFVLLDLVCEEKLLLPQRVADDKQIRALLEDFIQWVLSGGDHTTPSPPIRTLRQCAQWCQEQLFDVSEKLSANDVESAKHPNLQTIPSWHLGPWRDHVEVFGALWHRLAMQRWYPARDGVRGPEWARGCVRGLGISHEEVLSCMCWAIVRLATSDRAVEEGNGWARGGAKFEARELFARAGAAALEISEWDPEDLWIDFLTAFLVCNSVTAAGRKKEDVALREEVRRFKHGAMAEFRAFVNDTLREFEAEERGRCEVAPCGSGVMFGAGPVLPGGSEGSEGRYDMF